MKYLKEFTKGIFVENPIFIIMLGFCPFLAVSTRAINAIGMGAAILFVLLFSNILISLVRNFIPGSIRIACYIVIIATFVTITDLSMQAFTPELSKELGIFVPLIVVNCIILGRAEAFASKNRLFASILDAVGMAVGFTLALLVVSTIRELLGSGTITFMLFGKGVQYRLKGLNKMVVMVLPPGAFLLMGILMAIVRTLKAKYAGGKQS